MGGECQLARKGYCRFIGKSHFAPTLHGTSVGEEAEIVLTLRAPGRYERPRRAGKDGATAATDGDRILFSFVAGGRGWHLSPTRCVD